MLYLSACKLVKFTFIYEYVKIFIEVSEVFGTDKATKTFRLCGLFVGLS